MQAPFATTSSSPHAQATSTGTADVHTFTPPTGAHGFFVTVQTNNCYLTLDATTPDSTNGLHILKDLGPIFIPVGQTIKVASDAAGNSVVNVLWVS